jgi:hypothetical protein
VLAVAGLAVGGLGVAQALSASNTTKSLRSQLGALRARVGGDENHLRQQLTTVPGRSTMAAAQSDIAGLQDQLAGQGKTLSKLQAQDHTYANCIPELQTELNGLSINWSINTLNVGNSSFFINNSSQISHDCSKLLYGG